MQRSKVLIVLVLVAVIASVNGLFRKKRQAETCKDCRAFCSCLPNPSRQRPVPSNLRQIASAIEKCDKEEDAKFEKYEKCMASAGAGDDMNMCPSCKKLQQLEQMSMARKKRSVNRRSKRQSGFRGDGDDDNDDDYEDDKWEQCLVNQGINPNGRAVMRYENFMESNGGEDDVWDQIEKCENKFCGFEDHSESEQMCARQAGLSMSDLEDFDD